MKMLEGVKQEGKNSPLVDPISFKHYFDDEAIESPLFVIIISFKSADIFH